MAKPPEGSFRRSRLGAEELSIFLSTKNEISTGIETLRGHEIARTDYDINQHLTTEKYNAEYFAAKY
jgi:hypothetical protein